MSSDLRAQIRSRMNLKETNELLEIWQSNHRFEWSNEAFDTIKELLQERGVDLPEQSEPVYEEPAEEAVDGLEEWEAKVLDDENQPELYDTLEAITLKDHINKTLKAVIIINLINGLLIFNWNVSFVESYFPSSPELKPMVYSVAVLVTALSITVQIAIVYFPLKALTHILRILMEMEFRSRKAM